MNAVIEAYERAEATGQLVSDPDTTLVDYVTKQMVGDDTEDAYRLLSGLTTLLSTLLLHIESTQGVPRQASLDLLWDAIQAQAAPEGGKR
ncbi:hypothetical protein [Mycobacterium sp. 852002-53434_SCH5985345]|uniref:hypothetical protein n=1 Tax=Mycobacterium sp. 852002-53434_SCH5985345 TaxID=1834107 RepID=UPI0012E8E664|nr:hypothetical protein [Mycobacterium sp. 852002-53434_SCH5985345]